MSIVPDAIFEGDKTMRRKPFGAAIRWSLRIWIVCAGAALAVRLASGAVASEAPGPVEAGAAADRDLHRIS